MTGLTWRAPAYESDRRVALCGTVELGAVFPPCGGTVWRWRWWLGKTTEGTAKTEDAARLALACRFRAFLLAARLEPASGDARGPSAQDQAAPPVGAAAAQLDLWDTTGKGAPP